MRQTIIVPRKSLKESILIIATKITIIKVFLVKRLLKVMHNLIKKLTAIVLGYRISKSQQVTDWEAVNLTEAQQIYAATDAWVCREIYNNLRSERPPSRPSPRGEGAID